jgi:hypothetical protein
MVILCLNMKILNNKPDELSTGMDFNHPDYIFSHI